MFYGAYEMGVYLFFLIGNKKYTIQDKKNEESKYKVFMMVNTRKSKKQEGKKT